jgi:hypothetical protein
VISGEFEGIMNGIERRSGYPAGGEPVSRNWALTIAICKRKKRAQEALAYNSPIQSWPEIVRLAREPQHAPKQEFLL